MTGYATPTSSVGTDWLADHLDDPAIRVVEVDEDTTAYEKGHIPGAVMWNWATDLHAPVGSRLRRSGRRSRACCPRPGSVPTRPSWSTAATTTGSPPTGTGSCKLRGFANVKLLDGGRKKWELESRTTRRRTSRRTRRAGSRSRAPSGPGSGRSAQAVIDEVGTGTGFVDVRSPEEFRGERLTPDHLPQEAAQVPGHIAGAANIPWANAANEDGTFKSADELRAIYEAEGITGDVARDRVLPDRRACRAHVVRAARAARVRGRSQLRRQLDRVRLARGGARRARLSTRRRPAGGSPRGPRAGRSC